MTIDVELLLRETNHRCSNDLQLVVSLLALQSGRTSNDETRTALNDAAERVAVLARARAMVSQQRAPDLASALSSVCDALRAHAEPRGVCIELRLDGSPAELPAERITVLALVVNELMTNAIKHAFRERASGRITVIVGPSSSGDVTITVEDNGLPFREPANSSGSGLGLELARRLMASIDGLLIAPTGNAKTFELRAPTAAHRVAI